MKRETQDVGDLRRRLGTFDRVANGAVWAIAAAALALIVGLAILLSNPETRIH